MKFKLITIESSKEKWFDEATSLYNKKINGFCSFERISIKAKGLERKHKDQKKEGESALILDKLKTTDFVILCDERGKSFNSIQFSQKLVSYLENGHSNIVFVVGGAYGVSTDLRNRANLIWSLSDMVMNHFVAQVVVLEQIYRALTIWKGTPYHNE